MEGNTEKWRLLNQRTAKHPPSPPLPVWGPAGGMGNTGGISYVRFRFTAHRCRAGTDATTGLAHFLCRNRPGSCALN
jgi:hypothetical protein